MANPRHSAAKRQRELHLKDKARDKKERLAARRARKEAGLPDSADSTESTDPAQPDAAQPGAAVAGSDAAVGGSAAAQGDDNERATPPGSSDVS